MSRSDTCFIVVVFDSDAGAFQLCTRTVFRTYAGAARYARGVQSGAVQIVSGRWLGLRDDEEERFGRFREADVE